MLVKVDDCHQRERELIAQFAERFTRRDDIGAEYFEGSEREMAEIVASFWETNQEGYSKGRPIYTRGSRRPKFGEGTAVIDEAALDAIWEETVWSEKEALDYLLTCIGTASWGDSLAVMVPDETGRSARVEPRLKVKKLLQPYRLKNGLSLWAVFEKYEDLFAADYR